MASWFVQRCDILLSANDTVGEAVRAVTLATLGQSQGNQL